MYSSDKKHKKLFENWRRFLKEDTFNEAIVDVVADKLADVFGEDGKLIPEVSGKVKEAIQKTKQWLSQEHPELEVTEAFVVGAAVTYQYGPGSDIDVSLVIPGVGDKRSVVDKWLEQNLAYPNFKGPDGSDRPYQFKPMENNLGYDNVDAAYDPITEDWLKKPDIEKAKQMYQTKMKADSKEQQAFAGIEKNLKKHYQVLLNVLETTQDPQQIIKACLKTYERKKTLKAVRNIAFKKTETGYVSKNWGKGNVIYKMLDRDGYLQVFDLIKKLKKDNDLASNPEFINKLKSALQESLDDQLGFHGAKYAQAAE